MSTARVHQFYVDAAAAAVHAQVASYASRRSERRLATSPQARPTITATHPVDLAPQVWRRSTFGLFPS